MERDDAPPVKHLPRTLNSARSALGCGMSRILGIDHGTKRIGLALSDEMGIIANPLTTLEVTSHIAPDIAEIVRQKRVSDVVIGLPLRMSGERGSAVQRVEQFAARLRKHLPHEITVHFVDERLTSMAAEESLGLRNKAEKTVEEKKLVDQVAAVAILQDFLNTRGGPESWLLPEEE